MKVLIVSTNSLPAAPSGPLYLAGAARQAGHEVRIFDCLHASDLDAQLTERIRGFQPEVVAISIRLVFGDEIDLDAPLGTKHTDLRPRVKAVVELVRKNTDVPIIVGGPGFNYYARDWLAYLGLDYGIRGEGEKAFPLFLERLAAGGDSRTVPGCVARRNGDFIALAPQPVADLDSQALPAYDLLDWQPYALKRITPAIFTKRGCAYHCTYCPYSKLEGKRYRLKSPQRVLAEARHTRAHTGSTRIMLCDNNFNAPRQHAEAICRALRDEGDGLQWGSGDLRPSGVTDDFCRLMEDSGCFYANLAIESASEGMLVRMKRGYTAAQVRASLDALSRSTIPFSASLMIGAPGESPQTIAETLRLLDDYAIPNGVWVTIGVYLWTDYQDLVGEARRTGYLRDEGDLFRGAVYLSPELPRSYLRELPEMLRARPGFTVQFNKPSKGWDL